MTNVEILEKLTVWFNEKICPKILLKKPSDYVCDEDYEVEYVHPSAFAMYVPTNEDDSPSIPAPCPSICIQAIKIKDDLKSHKRSINIQLSISAWNPGIHSFECVFLKKDGNGMAYELADGSSRLFERNMDGWKDAMNMTDLILSELARTSTICGLQISQDEPIESGLFNEDGDIFDFYPYYFSYIKFTLECGIVRAVPEEYQNFL